MLRPIHHGEIVLCFFANARTTKERTKHISSLGICFLRASRAAGSVIQVVIEVSFTTTTASVIRILQHVTLASPNLSEYRRRHINYCAFVSS